MTPVEIIALIFALAVLVKMVFFFVVGPKKWLNFADKMFKKTVLLNSVILLIAVVLLAFLLQEVNIIQIWVAALFGMCLMALVFVNYHKGYLEIIKEIFKDRAKSWLIWAIFALLSIWVLYALFV